MALASQGRGMSVRPLPGLVGKETGSMTGPSLRCPRCKEDFASDDADQLADALIRHLLQEHGHTPPRRHVMARIERQNSTD
jgi:hypothetical protein